MNVSAQCISNDRVFSDAAGSFARCVIRPPNERDIGGILDVVRDCDPFLTLYDQYLFWRDVYSHADTCGVAEEDNRVVGWCSAFAMSGKDRFFLHHLGVASKYRRRGIGESLLGTLFTTLKSSARSFRIDFTVNQENPAALNLIKAAAYRADMQVSKSLGLINLPGKNCHEELYFASFSGLTNRTEIEVNHTL